MKKEIIYKTGYDNEKFFFIITTIEHPVLSREEIGASIDLPSEDYIDGKGKSIWKSTIWVKGSMDFFKEVKRVMEWMNERIDVLLGIKESGGVFQIEIGLSGLYYMRSSLDCEVARFILKLGIVISVTVFPSLEFGSKDLKSASRPRPETQDASWGET